MPGAAAEPVTPAAEKPAEPKSAAIDESLLGNDLLDDDFDFVDAPVAPPQLDRSPAAPPPPAPARSEPAPPTTPSPPPRPTPAEAPKPRPAPKVSPAPAPKVTASDSAQPASGGKRSDHGVLKFSQRPRGGLLSDDIGQTGGPTKLMMVLAVIVVAIAVGYFAFQLVTSS